MSFVYCPVENVQLEADLKKKSDEIVHMFECLSLNTQGRTLSSLREGLDVDADLEDMESITQTFDPQGVRDSFHFEKKSKISQLTELKLNVKFNYREYS